VQTLLPALIVMFVIAAVLRLTIGKKDRKIRMIPFQILSCVLVLLEIGKQGLSLYRGYDLYHLPFHFCSMLIFLPVIMAFYRGKHEKTVSCITTAVLAAVFILTAVYPDLIYSAQAVREFTTNFFSFHTVAFHNLAMLLFLLIPALDLHEPAPKGEPKKVLLFILGFCVISASMAHLLQTNFNNFYVCNIAPLEALRLSVEGALGRTAAAIFYVLIVTVMDLSFVTGSYWFYRLIRKLLTKVNKIHA
jgi:uncharacterized membrane protein YwaF